MHHFACFMAFRYIDVHSMLAEADVAMIEVGSPWFTCSDFEGPKRNDRLIL